MEYWKHIRDMVKWFEPRSISCLSSVTVWVRVVFRKTVDDQRHKYHHLTKTLCLTLKMTTAQVVETSVTNSSLSKDYSHPDDHTRQT